MQCAVIFISTHHRLQLWVHQNVAIVGDHKGVTINSDLKASNYIEFSRGLSTPSPKFTLYGFVFCWNNLSGTSSPATPSNSADRLCFVKLTRIWKLTLFLNCNNGKLLRLVAYFRADQKLVLILRWAADTSALFFQSHLLRPLIKN